MQQEEQHLFLFLRLILTVVMHIAVYHITHRPT
jgi:hypothetical protein